MGSPYVISYRGAFAFAAAPEVVWGRIERLDSFESWWGWLREFETDGGMRSGGRLSGVIEPPLPYRMRIDVLLERALPPERIDATVAGDLRGRAAVRLAPVGTGSMVNVAWDVEMMQPAMRIAARIAHPLLRWGHDRVVDATVSRFRDELAGR
jgi:hypothetical protein